ncbi:MAG: Gfo/Idh/MocA family oxidoreductase [Casimicrobiaceae bacterium]
MTLPNPLGIGVAGLGRAFALMLPTFRGDPRVRLVAATDPRADACGRFVQDVGGHVHADVAALCADPKVDVLYVATPHQYHADNVLCAARAGKHVLVEKPMAVTLDEARAMVDAAAGAGVVLLVGHSHSFDAPILRARALIGTPGIGALQMITAVNFTDFMYRPRRPEELATDRGGGVIFNQAAHQMDIVRLLGGGRVATVRGQAGRWDAARPTEGAYSAFLTFDTGACASLTYSGYAHFDSDELTGWIDEMGVAKDPARYGSARQLLATAPDPMAELALRQARGYGAGAADLAPARLARAGHQHFGFVLASCTHADVRPMPDAVRIYGDAAVRIEPLPLSPVPRVEVIDELVGAVSNGKAPVHDGRWAMATLEACLAILRSSREGREISLEHQVPAA